MVEDDFLVFSGKGGGMTNFNSSGNSLKANILYTAGGPARARMAEATLTFRKKFGSHL